MPVTETRCVVVICDNEGNAPGDGHGWEDGVTHWTTVEEACEALIDGYDEDDRPWLIEADRILCPSCNARRACGELGHQWHPRWLGCLCGGRNEGHPTADEHPPYWRSCRRCSAYERSDALPAPISEGTPA
jgi:hypothetical protein